MGKMNLELKKRIIKCLVWSVATYAAETWTLMAMDKRRIEVFKMWMWRRMERISYMDKVTNEDVLKRVDEDRSTVGSTYMHVGYKHAPHICTTCIWSHQTLCYFNGSQLRL